MSSPSAHTHIPGASCDCYVGFNCTHHENISFGAWSLNTAFGSMQDTHQTKTTCVVHDATWVRIASSSSSRARLWPLVAGAPSASAEFAAAPTLDAVQPMLSSLQSHLIVTAHPKFPNQPFSICKTVCRQVLLV